MTKGVAPEHLSALYPRARTLTLVIGALGIVYGDIGTSPLYAIRECFHGLHAIELTENNIMGVLSLVFWSLTVVVSVKYVTFILKADNNGEGGIFALLSLVPKAISRISRGARSAVVLAGIFGAALLYGDGIITPAISVLSAVEGLTVATEAARPMVLPLTIIILLVLFFAQHRGSSAIGNVFGPIMMLWFVTIAVLGVESIIRNPRVFLAINPAHGYEFFAVNRLHGMVVLGSVVLCITGGEALYADLGHFNRKAIRMSWLGIVFPALLLNYYGQGAKLLEQPELAFNPFYGLVPRPLLYPMVVLSTIATIIASQAMISGVFSLTHQAVQLGYLPRVHITHTSEETRGQIYISWVNWAMMFACIGLVLAFRESSRLAGAYGIAVTATMTATSIISVDVPHISPGDRLKLQALGQGFYRLEAHYGFTESPNVPKIMHQVEKLGLKTDPATTTFYLGRETLLTTGKSKMMRWRKVLFAFISRNIQSPAVYFRLPPDRVIELGVEVEF